MSEDDPGVEAWKRQTSAFDRVESVASGLSRPRSASYIASEAHVAENTARGHLERLVRMNVLVRETTEGTAVYAPDPLHTRMQAIRDLFEEHDHGGLLDLKAALQAEIRDWREEYGVDSPEALRTRGADADSPEETRTIARTANDWEIASYRLELVEEAIERYPEYGGNSRAVA